MPRLLWNIRSFKRNLRRCFFKKGLSKTGITISSRQEPRSWSWRGIQSDWKCFCCKYYLDKWLMFTVSKRSEDHLKYSLCSGGIQQQLLTWIKFYLRFKWKFKFQKKQYHSMKVRASAIFNIFILILNIVN